MNFEAAGSAVTYDSNSFAPDSASTATSIATGHKTYSGTINMSEDYTTAYETIAEKVHDQLGMSVGVITSVNLNHATPAAFYAHQASRNDYYEIGVEMVESGFEYFSGGALLEPTGSDGNQTDLYTMASQRGYQVVRTQAQAETVTRVRSSSSTNTSPIPTPWPTISTAPMTCGRWPIMSKRALRCSTTTRTASS